MTQKEIFEKLIDLFEETKFFIKTNALPIRALQTEPDPQDIQFIWKPLTVKSKEQKQKDNQAKLRANKEMINFPCSLCPNKTTGIKNFFYPGRFPILVLHYSGSSSPKEKPFIKKNPKQIFKDEITGKVWNDLIQNVYQFSAEELYYQEYPACNFNTTLSKDSDWKFRIDTCRSFVEENVRDFGIKGIILLGSSAKHVFGGEMAKQMLGKISIWDFSGTNIPVMTLRSPEALVVLDERSKQKNEEKTLFHYAEEKLNLENSFKEHLNELFKQLKDT